MKSDTNKEERGIREEDEVRLPAEPCLVVANHTCYFDPVIVAMCVDQPLCFVTGANLLCPNGLLSRIHATLFPHCCLTIFCPIIQ